MGSKHLEYSDLSLYNFINENSKRYPNRIAIEYFGKKISYAKFMNCIDEVAKALVGLGVKKGDFVSVCLPNTPEAIYLFYAINKVGAIANMIHPMSAENELVHYFTVSSSRFVFGLDMVAKRIQNAMKGTAIEKFIAVSVKYSMPLPIKVGFTLTSKKVELASETITWPEFMAMGKNTSEIAPINVDKNDCAVILYSGGTTGKSKGIMLSNFNFNALVDQNIEACGGLYEGMRVLSIMPIFHGFGLGVCVHTVLNFGATAIILPNFKAAEFHKLVFKYKPNLIAGVPAIYESFLKANIENKDLSFLECVIAGGDSLSVSTKEKFDKLLAACNCKTEVREGFGMTESVTASCLIPEKANKPGSCGLPYPDTFYKIVDPTTREELPTGEVGEIILRGPTVMLGYLNEPEETANTLRVREDGYTWLHTGDLGYMDEDGFIYYKQRLKRMIVSGGYNIYPQNIENVINSHENVLMCAVVGVPDQVMGEICKAFITLKNKDVDQDKIVDEIKTLCKTNVARYALPREYKIIDEIPRTKVGKIAYMELLEKYC